MQSFRYIIFGLSVQSGVELPPALRATSELKPDVTIDEAAVPDTLSGAEPVPGLQVCGDRVLLRLPGVLNALVERGERITFTRDASADPGNIVLYLLGTVFAIVLHQRGRIVLHASAVAVGSKAALFCGVSGEGKSTMAALLARRGYPVLNDDVCSLTRDPDGGLRVHPDGRMLKLWSASLDHLGLEADGDNRIFNGFDKFYIAPEQADTAARPVGAIYMLATGGERPTLRVLSALESVTKLMENAYRPWLVDAMGVERTYFEAAATLAGQSHIFELSRPKDFGLAAEGLDLLEQSWDELHNAEPAPERTARAAG